MKIICFDGIRGSGKSSQISLMLDFLLNKKFKVKKIHEKDYEPFRTLTLSWSHKRNKLFHLNDILEFAESRRKVYEQEVLGQKDSYDYFLYDRYFYTSAVYQQGILSMNEIISLNLNKGVPNPDYSFIFICNSEIALERMQARNRGIETLEELTKRKELYVQLCQQHPELYLIDTTSKSEERVFEEVRQKAEL